MEVEEKRKRKRREEKRREELIRILLGDGFCIQNMLGTCSTSRGFMLKARRLLPIPEENVHVVRCKVYRGHGDKKKNGENVKRPPLITKVLFLSARLCNAFSTVHRVMSSRR